MSLETSTLRDLENFRERFDWALQTFDWMEMDALGYDMEKSMFDVYYKEWIDELDTDQLTMYKKWSSVQWFSDEGDRQDTK